LIAPYCDGTPLALTDDMVPVWLDLSQASILGRLMKDLSAIEPDQES
jgi:hypothetical protein